MLANVDCTAFKHHRANEIAIRVRVVLNDKYEEYKNAQLLLAVGRQTNE